MSGIMNEDALEQARLDWLSGLDCACVHGDEVSPGGDLSSGPGALHRATQLALANASRVRIGRV